MVVDFVSLLKESMNKKKPQKELKKKPRVKGASK